MCAKCFWTAPQNKENTELFYIHAQPTLHLGTMPFIPGNIELTPAPSRNAFPEALGQREIEARDADRSDNRPSTARFVTKREQGYSLASSARV